MKVRYRPKALSQLDAIFAGLEAENPSAALKVVRSIKSSIERLADFPHSGRPSEVPGIRELPIVRYPYVVFYTVDVARDEVHILRMRHTSQDPRRHLD